MKILFLILIGFSFSPAMASELLAPFETDYCTNYPEGTRKHPDLWKHCCLIHDMFFWAGGSKQDRNNADLDLKSCIEKTGAAHQARIMYAAVRAGSYSPIKYPKKKWGNSWGDREEDLSLTREETEALEEEIYSGYNYIDPSIKEYFIFTLNSRLSP
jgi:hypothetical protein